MRQFAIVSILVFGFGASAVEAEVIIAPTDPAIARPTRSVTPAPNLRVALQCYDDDGRSYSCSCTDDDGRRQHAEECSDVRYGSGAVR
jgi:hypothetical protein